jgi:hypothetical protein
MAKRKRTARPEAAPASDAAALIPPAPPDSQIFSGGASLHDLFQQQVRETLDRSDLDEQAKQTILVALNCPCCGGGMNYTAKINRKR